MSSHTVKHHLKHQSLCLQAKLTCCPLAVQRLATTDWFTSRVSACGLFATAYPRSPSHLRADLRQLFGKLCRDDTPMVRRAAAFRLGKFAETMEPDLISKELIPLFQDLTQDGELTVNTAERAFKHQHAMLQIFRVL